MENNPINLNIEIEDIEIEEGNDNIEISVPFNPEEINIKISCKTFCLFTFIFCGQNGKSLCLWCNGEGHSR